MVVTPNPYGVGLNLYRHLTGSKHARLSARSHALPHSCRASPPRHLLPSPCRGSAWLSRTEGALYLSHLDGDINLAPSVRMGNVHGSTPLYRTRPMGGWLASHIHLSLGVVTVIAYGTAMIFLYKRGGVPKLKPPSWNFISKGGRRYVCGIAEPHRRFPTGRRFGSFPAGWGQR